MTMYIDTTFSHSPLQMFEFEILKLPNQLLRGIVKFTFCGFLFINNWFSLTELHQLLDYAG